jgi:serine/threonine protein kinase
MVRLPPGSRIDRFEIKSLIASGGMGTLYLARDTSPNTYRLVALKLLTASLDSQELRDRFGREARALASLNHPNVVNIHECGEYRGSPYIVMEYVRGETLAENIKRKAPLSLTDKLKLMMELCAGLAHAHEAGIIHRDIKPANLMVDHHGRLRLLDFGIARVVESGLTLAGLTMTQVNVRIGTPGYMSPEQYEGAEIDRRSDIFAVGAVFYELLAYREAFPGTTTKQIEKMVMESEPERLTKRIAGLEPEIEALVTKALQKNPDKRFQDAAEMERALTKVWWRLGLAESARPAPRPTPPVAGAGKKSSRADAAYQHAVAALNEGAPEAARRFAMEALAEDPKHDGARRYLAKHDPEFRLPNPSPPPPPAPPLASMGIEPTIVSSRAELNLPMSGGEETIVSAPGPRRAGSGQRSARSATVSKTNVSKTKAPLSWRAVWPSYRVAIAAAAVLLLVVVAVIAAILVPPWLNPSPAEGELLTIIKPVNGTIVGEDINCGTLGSTCRMTVATDTVVALELRPDDGFASAGYTGDCAQTGRVRMSNPRQCGATFVALPRTSGDAPRHTLTIFATEGGVVRGADQDCRATRQGCSQQFLSGQQVDLEVQADAGYTFDKFTGACDADGRVRMDGPQTCGASFVRNAGMGLPSANSPGPMKPNAPPTRGENATRADGKLPPKTPNAQGPGGSEKPGSGAVGAPGLPAGSDGAARTTAGDGQSTAPPPPPGADTKGPEGMPPPPPAAKSAEEQAKTDIQNVIERYRKAYEALDFEGIRQVFPTFNPGYIEQFKAYKKMTYALAAPEFVKLDMQEHTAVVKLGVTQTVQMKSEQKEKQGTIKTLHVTLHRRTLNNEWVILKLAHQ